MTVELDRQTAISQNRDPRGVQWAIFPQHGRALMLVYAVKRGEENKMVPDMKYNVPKECEGEWTHADKAQAAILKFLDRMWDESEKASLTSAKRERSAKRREDEQAQEVDVLGATD